MKLYVQDLIDKGLVKKKTYTEGRFKGLSVLKYSRKVFFDNLWHLDDRLLECRGTVVDEDWNVVVLPFKKVFNLGENNTQVHPIHRVVIPEKINGFMAAATLTKKYGLIISTTGSLDSEFVSLAEKHILALDLEDNLFFGETLLFEVCDKTDPHIIEEVEGVYLLGIRNHATGLLKTEQAVDRDAIYLQAKRPKHTKCFFKDIPETKREGFMIRCAHTGETLCKLKSPHYLSKKALQRCGKNKASKMFNDPQQFKQQLDEEFYKLFDKILDTFSKEDYLELTEQQRRTWIEENL